MISLLARLYLPVVAPGGQLHTKQPRPQLCCQPSVPLVLAYARHIIDTLHTNTRMLIGKLERLRLKN